ncbi:PDR/VanB family oxidoreductase [Brytella acorum]|uniref:PDR/VanB family oxidoreductase n=1 Tax=Brytella acorum TaxID=2959299 RepID=A0AA35Y4A1_9PROT|nr:PDR/VanB family oxidoreductase [Brytella acorum]MDF3625842.1 PDR/VanB family oxidoreductase [Brytella acorum]CAI9121604.1 PDR/VanB family oxidoreductase [Brytella acorum]
MFNTSNCGELAMTDPILPVRVTRLVALTHRILGITLKPENGASLTPVVAGAHIDLHIPCEQGLIRQYSLTNAPGTRDRYEIAVLLEPQGRGGSAWIHSHIAVGDRLEISAPRDRFALFEPAPHHVLIAGGIGIAPIWSLAQRLMQIGASWEMHYAAATENDAAFVAEIRKCGTSKLKTYFPQEGRARLSFEALAQACAPDSHVYCCGPARMMDDFDAAFGVLPQFQRHREHFAAVAAPAKGGNFEVVLARTGCTVQVGEGQTILEAVRAAGVSAIFSCAEGVCGMCETRLIEGVADHRDSVMTAEEQARGETMMICCSGAKTRRLVLDL